MEGLNSWLQEVEAFLQAEEDLPVGDIEMMEAQLEQSNVSICHILKSFNILLGKLGIERKAILSLILRKLAMNVVMCVLKLLRCLGDSKTSCH